MRCYAVLPTGFLQGFLEVVPNAITEDYLMKKHGFYNCIKDSTIIDQFLREHNTSESEYRDARYKFVRSNSAYAVATGLLGIADRHPGNIMIQTDGHFFHIDFGHFLGNFKVKFGIKREDAPYHVSPFAAYVLGYQRKEEDNKLFFKEFEKYCGIALNILRKSTDLIINLFLLMVNTGIPELRNVEDIKYLQNYLFPGLTDEQATAEFSKLTQSSIESTRTMTMALIHMLL